MAPLCARFHRFSVPLGLAALLVVTLSAPALAQDDDPTSAPSPSPPPAEAGEGAAGGPCLVTGYLTEPDQELSSLLDDLETDTVHGLDGSRLESGQTWVIPDGRQPVVVVDSTNPLTRGAVSTTVAGQETEVSRESFEESRYRYVTRVSLPQLGPTVRTLGMTVQSPPCPEVELTLAVDRSVWSTLVGGAGIAATALFGLLLVLVARLRKGGWLRRFAFAVPFGLLAGAGQGAVLLEAGVVSPFGMPPWWLTLVGLALAALLPLTRWWRRREPAEVAFPVPPVVAPMGGYQVGDGLVRTDTSVIYRATRPAAPPPPAAPAAERPPAEPEPAEAPTEAPASQPVASEPPLVAASPPAPEPALVKVAVSHRYGEPTVRMRLEREARALDGLQHPNVLALREVFASPAGPTLVYEYVDGVPLRRLLAARGSLSGPQVASVVLGVLAGLGAVHDRGLVHRDARPENLWLTTDGRVLLAGFELACAGAEHPVAPDGTLPYASPEQRYGRVLDGRSDLWTCGVLLAELLTGRVPPRAVDLSVPAAPAGIAAGLPESLATLLARVLAEDPAGRPASAGQFATELRAAAEAAFGPDWAARGVLAGAVVADGATGTGYVLAGADAAGAPAAGGTPGVPAAAPSARKARVRTGVPGAVVATVNFAIAVCVAAAVTATVVLIDLEPVEAREAELINPELAQAIVIRTVDAGWDRVYRHFGNEAERSFDRLIERESSVVNEELAEPVVGVPPDQLEYPAWFLASARLPAGDGEVSIVARFDRVSENQRWRMTELTWSADRLLPGPLLDGDWLAPMPETGDLLVDPEDLPGRYADWLARAAEDDRIGTDEVLTLRAEEADSGLLHYVATTELPGFDDDTIRDLTTDWKFRGGDVTIDERIPMAGGTVYVQFEATGTYTTRYRDSLRRFVCEQVWLGYQGSDVRYRNVKGEVRVSVDAWIPIRDLVPEPVEEPDEGEELALEPVDPEIVVIEDWQYFPQNVEGDRC